MANEIRDKYQGLADFTITLASLANGNARQSTLISNANAAPRVAIYLRIQSGGTAPTAGASYDVFLLRKETATSPSYGSDNAGNSDAAITIENAQYIGSLVVTNTANKNFYGEFVVQDPGPYWGIAIRNSSGQALNATEANHLYKYQYITPEVQ